MGGEVHVHNVNKMRKKHRDPFMPLFRLIHPLCPCFLCFFQVGYKEGGGLRHRSVWFGTYGIQYFLPKLRLGDSLTPGCRCSLEADEKVGSVIF